MAIFHLHTVFSSLQGEGRNVGRPATFVRLSGCNLACKWCDTHKDERMTCTAEEIVKKVGEHSNKSVIITGGEPTVQKDLDVLVRELKDAGYWVALETNGVRAPVGAELFDYISVSPKPDYFSRYMDNIMLREANEVRIVATTDEIVGFCRRPHALPPRAEPAREAQQGYARRESSLGAVDPDAQGDRGAVMGAFPP